MSSRVRSTSAIAVLLLASAAAVSSVSAFGPGGAAAFEQAVRGEQVQINPPPTSPVGQLTLVSCDAVAERVVVRNATSSSLSLTGYVLIDRGRNFETPLAQWGALAPGASLGIVSGLFPVARPGDVIWLDRNIWNNDGDEATLIAPDGSTSVVSC